MLMIVDLGDAVADELYVSFDQISLEMIYRGLYHFSVAYQKGITTDPVKYFAAPENQDLGILKQQRKPRVKLIIAPFLEQQRGSHQFFSSLFSNPLDICHTSLTCGEWWLTVLPQCAFWVFVGGLVGCTFRWVFEQTVARKFCQRID
jgi:hypothetical protein